MADADTQLMLMLGALAGLRRAEIASLAAVDVYLDRQPPILILREGKGMKDRIVPLHPLLVELLRQRRSGWVFPHPQRGGEPLDADSVGRRLAKALSYGGTRITGHQLRHYFGTEAARWSDPDAALGKPGAAARCAYELTSCAGVRAGWRDPRRRRPRRLPCQPRQRV